MKRTLLPMLALAATTLAAQKTIYVNHLSTGPQTGDSWPNAFNSLHTALDASLPGDQIWVAAGTYKPDSGTNRDKSFQLKSGVKLFGGFAGTETNIGQRNIPGNPVILDGNIGNQQDSLDNSYTILYMEYPDTSTRIDGLIFQHGFAYHNTITSTIAPEACGGAVFILAKNGKAQPVFTNCIFRYNVARMQGGAVYVQGQGTQGSMPLFHHCQFLYNRALTGGAVYIVGGSSVDRGIEFDHCLFEGNFAEKVGGAIYIYGSIARDVLNFNQCVSKNNDCGGTGGFILYEKTNAYPFLMELDGCDFNSTNSESTSLIFTLGGFQECRTKFVMRHCRLADHTFSPPIGSEPSRLFVFNIIPLTSGVDTFIFTDTEFINNHTHDFWVRIVERAGYVQFKNNYFRNNTELVINAEGSEFSNNRTDDSPVYLVFRKNNKNYRVYNNIFSNSSYGLSTAQNAAGGPVSDTVCIANNLFYGNSKAFVQNYAVEDSSTFYLELANNIFLQNNTLITQQYHLQNNTNQVYLSHCLMDQPCLGQSGHILCGPGNILSTDTGLLDPEHFDFHAGACAPGIDRGSNEAIANLGLSTDLDGNPRIQASIIDIGPYEHAGFTIASTTARACAGTAGGSISLQLENGCEPYQFQWSPPVGNGPEINELPAGSYYLTITDGSQRVFLDTFLIEAANPPSIQSFVQNLTCGSPQGGTASVSLTGNPNPPYEYTWSNGFDGSIQYQLPAGLYTVTVTDATGCSATLDMTIEQSGNLTLSINGTPVSCHGGADGQLSALATTGQPPFHYLWSDGNTESDRTALPAGPYSVTATDAYGCTASWPFNLPEPAPVTAAVTQQPCTSLQTPNGSASLLFASGGTPPYTFAWSTGSTDQSIHSLAPGTYTLVVTDAKGCTGSATAEISLSSVTLESNVAVIVVSPNPVTDVLDIDLGTFNPDGCAFQLMDALGRQVLRQPLHRSKSRVELGWLPTGVYVWTVTGFHGDRAVSGRVVKQR